jgi:hypothetical protein
MIDDLLLHRFCDSLHSAEREAGREAADTCGIVLRVKSIRIEPNRLVLTGLIPANAFVFEHPSESTGYLQPRSIGNLYLTQTSPRASAGNEIAYLVLHTPVAAEGLLSESEDGDAYWVAIAVERTFQSLPPGSFGAICCARCHRPISHQRLLAVPNTRVCTNCQQKKEKNDRSNQ